MLTNNTEDLRPTYDDMVAGIIPKPDTSIHLRYDALDCYWERFNTPVTDSAIKGYKTEIYFHWLMRHLSNVSDVIRSSANDDRVNHIDFFVHWADGNVDAVDVKSQSNISRNDASIINDDQNPLAWVQLHGKKIDNRGWLHESKSTLFAFETATEFRLVKKGELEDYVEKHVNFSNVVSDPSQALLAVYKREEHESASLLPVFDLPCIFRLPKMNEILVDGQPVYRSESLLDLYLYYHKTDFEGKEVVFYCILGGQTLKTAEEFDLLMEQMYAIDFRPLGHIGVIHRDGDRTQICYQRHVIENNKVVHCVQ
jgi:hypothetical protein